MSDFPLQMPEASYIQVDSNCATESFHLAFILIIILALAHGRFLYLGKDAVRHEKPRLHRVRSCRRRSASYLIRSGWFTKQRQLNLLRKAACKVVRFHAADKAGLFFLKKDKAGQRGDEGCPG